MKVEINAIKDEYTYIAEKLCICGRRERGLNIKINKVNIERLQSDDIEVESKSKLVDGKGRRFKNQNKRYR